MKATVCLALSLLALGQGIEAQTAGRDVRGRIYEIADSTRPVVGAEVEVLGTAVRTNNAGEFRLPAVPPGEHDVRVRRLGFKSVTHRLTVASDGDVTVHLGLERNAAELTEVVIDGRRVWVPPRLGEVYTRAARGWGKLFTADDIREQNPSDLKALLNGVPTVHTNDRGVTFNRCQAGLDAVSNALSGGGGGASRGPGRHPGKVQVYVDGLRLSRSSGEDADMVLKEIHPSSVAAMEVYTGVARLPGEFHTDACAAIAIWTKSY